jgi:hypothetical protein
MGALLFAAHGAAPPRGALICGSVAAAAHWAASASNADAALRRALVSTGLLDEVALPTEAPAGESEGITGGGVEGGLPGSKGDSGGWWARLQTYLPIRRMTEEEWEEYQARQEAASKERNALLANSSTAQERQAEGAAQVGMQMQPAGKPSTELKTR